MSSVCTFDGLSLNDRVLYFRMPGFDPGENEVTFDEFPSYDGGVVVRNVSRAHVVELALPVDVRAGSEASMLAGVAAINTKVRACSSDAPKTLTVGGRSYHIVAGTELDPPEDDLYLIHVARLVVSLRRLP